MERSRLSRGADVLSVQQD